MQFLDKLLKIFWTCTEIEELHLESWDLEYSCPGKFSFKGSNGFNVLLIVLYNEIKWAWTLEKKTLCIIKYYSIILSSTLCSFDWCQYCWRELLFVCEKWSLWFIFFLQNLQGKFSKQLSYSEIFQYGNVISSKIA